jgi:hypothetical protein
MHGVGSLTPAQQQQQQQLMLQRAGGLHHSVVTTADGLIGSNMSHATHQQLYSAGSSSSALMGQPGQHLVNNSYNTLHNSISLPGSGYSEFLSAVRPTAQQLQQAQQQQQQLAMAQLQLQRPMSPVLGGGWQRMVDRMPPPGQHMLLQQQQQGYAAMSNPLLSRGVTTSGPLFVNSQGQFVTSDGQLAVQQQQFRATQGTAFPAATAGMHMLGAENPWLLEQQQQQQQQQMMMQLNSSNPAYGNMHPGMNLSPPSATPSSSMHHHMQQQQQMATPQLQTTPAAAAAAAAMVQQEAAAAAAAAAADTSFISLSELAGGPQEGLYAVSKARAEAAVPLEAGDGDSKRCAAIAPLNRTTMALSAQTLQSNVMSSSESTQRIQTLRPFCSGILRACLSTSPLSALSPDTHLLQCLPLCTQRCYSHPYLPASLLP